MRREVEDFLKQHETQEAEAARQRRGAHLMDLGLFEIHYPQEGEDENDYPDFEEGQRCRKLPLELTDEEYAAVCAVIPAETKKKKWPIWPVHQMLFVLAMVFYGVAAISALFSMVNSGGYGYNFAMFLSTLYLCLLYGTIGTLLLAVSEIVRLMKKRAGEE